MEQPFSWVQVWWVFGVHPGHKIRERPPLDAPFFGSRGDVSTIESQSECYSHQSYCQLQRPRLTWLKLQSWS